VKATVYTTPTCSFCFQVKQYLTRADLPFQEVDVTRDQQAAAEMVRVSGQQGVPVTVIDNEVIVGFDRQRLDKAIAEAKRPRLGAAVANASDMAAKGRCSAESGAYIGRVSPGGVADKAGLVVGDIVIALGNRSVKTALDLERLIAGVRGSGQIPVAYVRAETRREAMLTF